MKTTLLDLITEGHENYVPTLAEAIRNNGEIAKAITDALNAVKAQSGAYTHDAPQNAATGVQLPEGAIPASYIEAVWVAARGADSVDGVAYVDSPGIIRIDPVKESFRSLEFSRTDLLTMLALLETELE